MQGVGRFGVRRAGTIGRCVVAHPGGRDLLGGHPARGRAGDRAEEVVAAERIQPERHRRDDRRRSGDVTQQRDLPETVASSETTRHDAISDHVGRATFDHEEVVPGVTLRHDVFAHVERVGVQPVGQLLDCR